MDIICIDKTIKLWKVFEKSMYRQSGGKSFSKKYYEYKSEFDDINGVSSDVKLPNLPNIERDDIITAAISRRVYSNGHKFHIHSLEVNCDCETFISCDDLRINLWNFDSPSNNFVLCDLKPDSIENLTKTITSVSLNPIHCNIMSYATSMNKIYLCDMRTNCQIYNNSLLLNNNNINNPNFNYNDYLDDDEYISDNDILNIDNDDDLLNHNSQIYSYNQPILKRDFYSDIGSLIRSIKFSNNGMNIIVRDYFNSYIWDIRNNSKPISIIPIQPYFKENMKNLYETDFLFDKFKICGSNNNDAICTGTYNNSFIIANYINNRIEKCVLSSKSVNKFNKLLKKYKNNQKIDLLSVNNTFYVKQKEQELQKIDKQKRKNKKDIISNDNNSSNNNNNNSENKPNKTLNWMNPKYFQNGSYEQKILHMSFHPNDNVIAAVQGPALYIFQKKHES